MNTKELALHTTHEKSIDGERQTFLYISDGEEVKRLAQKSKVCEKFLAGLKKGTTIRSTSANSSDMTLFQFDKQGAAVKFAHWHATGIEKGLDPEEIVLRYAQCSPDIFRPMRFRSDIARLRELVGYRQSIIESRGDAIRKLKSRARNVGIVSTKDFEKELLNPKSALTLAHKEIESDLIEREREVAESETSLDTLTANHAKTVPECVLFRKIAHMDSWIIPAIVVSVSGDPARFDSVYAINKYFGQHVVDGIMPKRQAGTAMDWNPRGRRILHILWDCIMKNRNNPWRELHDAFRADELADHRHKGVLANDCKSIDGHCTSRAGHKVSKEILKRWYLACTEQPFVKGHNPISV